MGQHLVTPPGMACDPPHVEYRLDSNISSSSNGVLRYAAYHKVMQNDQSDPSMACSFPAFRFETKGTTEGNINSVHFEFALVNDNSLYNFASVADPYTFADQLVRCPEDPHTCVFTNLGGDAKLVSPKNEGNGDKDRYGHIAAFLRKAPTEQIQSVWKTVAETYRDQLRAQSPQPVWFSAAGGGVAWLHFRFDRRPKYYHYTPFKQTF
ncbi:unnamed protein product [Cylindrotheca closterium]|uniref:Uncharacterized protein n=1 Tax=Cylindrotheca closterium TaxID=2856 RepID=A0AAD2JK22_9STRA|nr:unnamed protein product [Cylindrotheca closterium]